MKTNLDLNKINWSHWFECIPGYAIKCRILKKLKWINMYKIFTEEYSIHYVGKSSLIKMNREIV